MFLYYKEGRIVMKGFRRLTITVFLLAGMAGVAFCGTDYFLVVEQKPEGGFAQTTAMAIIQLLDDADTVSIIGVSNIVTLLLPPMPLGTPGLLAIVNGVLLKPVLPAAGKTPPKYSPAMAAAVNLADEQAEALVLAQPGRDVRLVIITETTPKAEGVSLRAQFSRIDYISLNTAPDPTLAAFAKPGDVWELAEEQPDPAAAGSARPFAEGFLAFVQTINGNYTAAKMSDAGDNFTLGDFAHTVQNAVVITAGGEATVSREGASADDDTAYHYGAYSAFVLLSAGGYKVDGVKAIFGGELSVLSTNVIIIVAALAVLILVLTLCGAIRFIIQFKPVWRIEIEGFGRVFVAKYGNRRAGKKKIVPAGTSFGEIVKLLDPSFGNTKDDQSRLHTASKFKLDLQRDRKNKKKKTNKWVITETVEDNDEEIVVLGKSYEDTYGGFQITIKSCKKKSMRAKKGE
jgi:hypothetical protein